MTTSAIQLSHVTKRFGRKVAIDDLGLEVCRGELFAFLGPNGAGKTTTIKMICGLLQPDAGQVVVCGTAIGDDGLGAKSKLAYVPDQPFLYEKLTGWEFLRFVGQMYRLDRKRFSAASERLVEAFDMRSFLDQLAGNYSHGMKQRLVLASALLHDPEVLVIDEPMVGLDPRTVRVVKDLFRQRVSGGATVFMSTHTLEVAEAVADRIGIIDEGKLVALGRLEELQAQRETEHSLEDIFLDLTARPGDPGLETVPT